VPLALVALLLLGACRAAPTTIQEGRFYPVDAAHGPTLDIQVFRASTRIEMTNTTATPFGPSTMWLNARFSRTLPGLAPGEHTVLALTDFKDQFGESFRAGGFFARETPDLLSLAEIETVRADGSKMVLGLVVVGQDPETSAPVSQ
jgi:hypothetical protein